jgi:hypothetical protein
MGGKVPKNYDVYRRRLAKKRLDFIEETYQYKDFKSFFTDMWDAIVLAGKHALLPFELFQSLQCTYSWMKYYNSELASR